MLKFGLGTRELICLEPYFAYHARLITNANDIQGDTLQIILIYSTALEISENKVVHFAITAYFVFSSLGS